MTYPYGPQQPGYGPPQAPGYPPQQGYGYPQQPGYGYEQQAYGYQQPPAIPTYKGWAIFTLFFGFLFGVVALIKVNEVEVAVQRGDFHRAWQASNTAKILCVIGNVFGLLCLIGLVIWAVVIAS